MNYFKTITKFIYLTAVLFTLSLQAQAIDYSKLLEPVEVMDSSILDSYKFMYKDSVSGDEVDPATGRLGFSVTDIAIPGNFSIAVALTRKLRTDDTDLGGPAGWTWDIPYIKGYYLKSLVENTDEHIEYYGDGWHNGKNCSAGGVNIVSYSGSRQYRIDVDAMTYWQGKTLSIPNVTNENFLVTASGEQQTKSNFKVIACISNYSGEEGFKVKGPDGTLYEFNDFRSYDVDTRAQYAIYQAKYRKYVKLIRITKITDRFGNYVNYNYQGGDLASITSSDGRSLSIAYQTHTDRWGNPRNRATQISSGGRTWTFGYAKGFNFGYLDTVTLPDSQYAWSYEQNIYQLYFDPDFGRSPLTIWSNQTYSVSANNCSPNINPPIKSFVVVNPYGLTTEYQIARFKHTRSNVDPLLKAVALYNSTGPKPYIARNQACTLADSLVTKTITGPGLSPQVWNYAYSQNKGLFTSSYQYLNDTFSGAPDISVSQGLPSNVQNTQDYRTVTVTGPDDKKVYFIDRKADSPSEGMVVATDTLNLNDQLMMREEQRWGTGVQVGSNWYIASRVTGSSAAGMLNTTQTQYRINKTQDKTSLYNQGGTDTYYNNYSGYDSLGFFNKTSESNNFSTNKRYTDNKVINDVGNWILGIPWKSSVSQDNVNWTTQTEIIYHGGASANGVANTGKYLDWYVPYEMRSYGTWLYRYTDYYDVSSDSTALGMSGSLKRIEANKKIKTSPTTETASNVYQQYSSYKRGIAQSISMPSRYSSNSMSMSRIVDYFGQITRITNLNGTSVSYSYDKLGRLNYVDMPSQWLDTYIDWSANSNEITRTATNCQLNASRTDCQSGTAVKTSTAKLDALLRLTSSNDRDLNTGISRYNRFEFDSNNNPTFISYPSYNSWETSGTYNDYDALGRQTKSSLSGGGTDRTDYLNANQVRTTNAAGYQTTSSYLAYGTPEQKIALETLSPEGVSLSNQVNVFGNITSTTQTGPGKYGNGTVSLTEYRVFDSKQRLCKTVRADVGSNYYAYNDLGELVLQAPGISSNTNNTCNTLAQPVQITNTYDNLGKIWRIDYPDAPDRTYTYDNQGNLTQLVSGGLLQYFNYYDIGLIKSENLVYPGSDGYFNISHTYDALGSLSTLTYPNGDTINYAPNAFGQATQALREAGSLPALYYANNVQYHANGSIKSFAYGNGLNHETRLNSRQLPSDLIDSRAGLTAVGLGYTYESLGKVNSITDQVDPNFSTYSISYDGRGRILATAGGPSIGSSLMTYDGLDNIAFYQSRNRTMDHYYDSNNMLSYVASFGSEAKSYSSFSYDARGNITNNGNRSFTYNTANQMIASGSYTFLYDGFNRRIKEVDSSGTSYSYYSKAGQLLHRKTASGGLNYIYLGKQLIAKDGVIEHYANKQHYRPFGDTIERPIDDIGFTGHKYDPDLGLVYAQARYYDPVIGRFYSPDPIGSADQFNLFAYVGNDPVNNIDSNGKEATCTCNIWSQTVRDLTWRGIQQLHYIGNVLAEAVHENTDTPEPSISPEGKEAPIAGAEWESKTKKGTDTWGKSGSFDDAVKDVDDKLDENGLSEASGGVLVGKDKNGNEISIRSGGGTYLAPKGTKPANATVEIRPPRGEDGKAKDPIDKVRYR